MELTSKSMMSRKNSRLLGTRWLICSVSSKTLRLMLTVLSKRRSRTMAVDNDIYALITEYFPDQVQQMHPFDLQVMSQRIEDMILDAVEEASTDQYDEGFNDGRDAGYDSGYDSGHSSGYDEGYEAGYESARDAVLTALDD